ncbi:hypothetical protein HanRHA438_Chr03g0135011 [Helianthus annuus]|nr:hypothetical protein HanRHA438_Chr03g0135011 [Helianthus annuus]
MVPKIPVPKIPGMVRFGTDTDRYLNVKTGTENPNVGTESIPKIFRSGKFGTGSEPYRAGTILLLHNPAIYNKTKEVP